MGGQRPLCGACEKSLKLYPHRRNDKVPEGLPEEMLKNRAGTFVSHEGGRLRGCIKDDTRRQTCIAGRSSRTP
ncbi:MAG: hypothetical protein ACLVJO_11440 [[Clostridium] scindens]